MQKHEPPSSVFWTSELRKGSQLWDGTQSRNSRGHEDGIFKVKAIGASVNHAQTGQAIAKWRDIWRFPR